MNILSEIEDYYKKREQQLIEKLHKQEAALAAANQKLKQLTENQRAPMDETAEQQAAREQKLKEELYRDPLTGAYNRRYYEEVVRKTIGPAGVALLDVDDFKICNDTYGHHAGDMALKTAANAILSRIRKSDLLIRYGGDEFLLVLKRLNDPEAAMKKCGEICEAFRNYLAHEDLPAACSGGVVPCGRNEQFSAGAVERADQALYRAQRENQGGCCLWTEG